MSVHLSSLVSFYIELSLAVKKNFESSLTIHNFPPTMMPVPGPDPTIQLLQCSIDAEDEDESEFRLLIDNKYVKYITIDAGLYSCDDMRFEPTLISLLPPLPPGDWNEGHISRNPATGEAHFARVSKTQFPGVTNTWHPVRIDHLDLHMGQKLCSNVYEAICDRFDSPVIVKFARFPWEVPRLQVETTTYEWLEGHQIGPSFLGHLVEEGRVIGFIIALVSDCRHATPDDFPLCHQVLSKLHQLGIKHGDTNKHNFLIHSGKATLIDFENASRAAGAYELEGELNGLMDRLRDASGRGGVVIDIV